MHPSRYALLSCVFLSACATSLSARDIGTYGTRQLTAPKERVFAASQAALARMGFRIASEDRERGVLFTEPGFEKTIVDEVGTPPDSTLFVTPEHHRYTVEISAVEGGKVQVRLVPHLYSHGAEVSTGRVWVLADEKEHWAAFFQYLDEAM